MTLKSGSDDKDLAQPCLKVLFLPSQTAITNQDFLKPYQIIFIFGDTCNAVGFCIE